LPARGDRGERASARRAIAGDAQRLDRSQAAAEQDALRMSFILQKEKQEAERKRIEAQGISDFRGLWRRASARNCSNGRDEATEKLATSTNAKIVIIGIEERLPLVLEPR